MDKNDSWRKHDLQNGTDFLGVRQNGMAISPAEDAKRTPTHLTSSQQPRLLWTMRVTWHARSKVRRSLPGLHQDACVGSTRPIRGQKVWTRNDDIKMSFRKKAVIAQLSLRDRKHGSPRSSREHLAEVWNPKVRYLVFVPQATEGRLA